MNIHEKEMYQQAVVMTIADFFETRPMLAPTELHLKAKQKEGMTVMSPKGLWAFNHISNEWMPVDFVNDANACEVAEETLKSMGYLGDYTRYLTALVGQRTPFTPIDDVLDSMEEQVHKTAYNTGLVAICKSDIRSQAMFMFIKAREKQRAEEEGADEESEGNVIQMP